jgi:hypothetical protein
MKKAIFHFLLPLCFTACTSSTPDASAAANKDSLATPPVPLPYTATYSSNFVPGKQSDVLTVLNNYKDWETNDMKAMRTTMGDTVELVFSSGMRIKNTGDSLVKMATKYRDSLSMINLTIYAWTSNHSVDKNADWVNVWYKEIDTYKTGKVDSVAYEDDNMLVNGKIVYTSSHSQKLPK